MWFSRNLCSLVAGMGGKLPLSRYRLAGLSAISFSWACHSGHNNFAKFALVDPNRRGDGSGDARQASTTEQKGYGEETPEPALTPSR